MRIRYKYRTDYLIRQAEREYWAEQLGHIGRRLLRVLRRIIRETLRLIVLLVWTSLFTFVAIPIMETYPERVLLITELLAVLAFALWIGKKLYAGKEKRK